MKMAKKKRIQSRRPRRKSLAGKARKFRAAASKRRSKLIPKSRRKAGIPTKASGLSPKLTKKAEEQGKKAESLLARGRARGFVTYDEILKSFPNIETDVLFLEELYEKFSTAGIDVLEGGGMLEIKDEPAKKSVTKPASKTKSVSNLKKEVLEK